MNTPSVVLASASLPDPTTASRKNRLLRVVARAGGALSGPVSGTRWFPLWAIVSHTGRRSGRAYRTPIAVQRTPDGFLVTLPFGAATQWVRNVLAEDGCSLRWRGRDVRLADPRIVDWSVARSRYGLVLRTVIPVLGVRTFLHLADAA